jgi:hypothetical protein
MFMRKKINGKKGKVLTRDGKKENILRELSRVLLDAGYIVRRETLKRGHGWRVMSGECRSQSEDFIFVDRRMSQDDQISFLLGRMRNLDVHVDEKACSVLPQNILGYLKDQEA